MTNVVSPHDFDLKRLSADQKAYRPNTIVAASYDTLNAQPAGWRVFTREGGVSLKINGLLSVFTKSLIKGHFFAYTNTRQR